MCCCSAIVFTGSAFSQSPVNELSVLVHKIISKQSFDGAIPVQQPGLLQHFYEKNGYALQWYAREEDAGLRQAVYDMITNGWQYVLSSGRYHEGQLRPENRPARPAKKDSLLSELMHTDAVLAFLHDIAYGEGAPYLRYNGIHYNPGCFDLPALLQQGLADKAPWQCIPIIEPKGERYHKVKAEYIRLYTLSRQPGFREITVSGTGVAWSNKNLVLKLRQLGWLADSDSAGGRLQEALGGLQLANNRPVQASFKSCLAVLNEPIAAKLQKLAWNMRWFRWLNCVEARTCVVINIPASHLWYFENGAERICCKTVVGKPSTKSPTLTSSISKVIYYPYWNIPNSIATKEMLPLLKSFPGLLDRMHIDVLKNGKLLTDADNINWALYSRSYFPFELRQQPGCFNSLGLLKFDFPSPFHTYLHDTNYKGAFQADRRFMSHGCFRVEQPYELAVALGVPGDKINMDTCLTGMKPVIFTLPQPVPVFIIYATVDVINGQLKWYDDIYGIIKKR